MARVAMLIPGIMGSELWLDDDLIWPGAAHELLLPYRHMKELRRPDLRVGDVIRSFSISSQYQDLIDDLGACDFTEIATKPTLVIFPYDWRKSNALTAERLATRIDEIAAQHGPDAEIFLIAHSMGGLISRYYLESGTFSGRPGFGLVKWLITIGTPHRGAPLALTAAMGLEKRLFLNADQVLQLASDREFPSVYELLPEPGEPFVWNDRAQATYNPLNVFTPPISAKLGLVPENLTAAQALRSKLDHTRRPPGVRYFTFAGNQQTSLTGVRLLDVGSKYDPRKIEPDDGGDGTVPIWSSLLPGVQSKLVAGEHGTLYKTQDLRRTLAVLLGKPGVLAAFAPTVEVSVRDRVVHPSNNVHVVIGFPSPVTTVRGELRFERARDVASAAPAAVFGQVGPSQPVIYTGANAERLSIVVRAPAVNGAYRVAFYVRDSGDGPFALAGFDDLFVQQPS